MKTPSILIRVAFLAVAFGTCGMTTTFAQTPPAAPAPATSDAAAGPTTEEKAEYAKDRDQVLAANADLKKEYDALKKQMDDQRAQGASVSRDDRKALRTKMHDFEVQKLRPEMLKIDAALAPIFVKMDAVRKNHQNAAASQT